MQEDMQFSYDLRDHLMRLTRLPVAVFCANLAAITMVPAWAAAQSRFATPAPVVLVPATALVTAPPLASFTLVQPQPAGSRAAPFLRDHAALAAVTLTAIAAGASADRWAEHQLPRTDNRTVNTLSMTGEHIGNPAYVAPLLLAGYALGKFRKDAQLSGASLRIAGAVGGAVVLAEGVKLAVGRARPYQAPGDPDDFSPFRGNNSFPSGHTTLAFAFASAIDAETDRRWVPWVVYPAATLTAWSRVQDGKHWMSDVVGGAALGLWAGRRIDQFERDRLGSLSRVKLVVKGSRHSMRAGLRMRF